MNQLQDILHTVLEDATVRSVIITLKKNFCVAPAAIPV